MSQISASKSNADTLKVFSNLDRETRRLLAKIERPGLLGLACLFLANRNGNRSSLTVVEIEDCLVEAGVSVRATSITRSFSRMGNMVRSSRIDSDVVYRLMTEGEQTAEKLIQSGNIQLQSVDSGTPYTSRLLLEQVLRSLQGDVRICDPYLGLATFQTLRSLSGTANVRFLTGMPSGSNPRLQQTVRDFQTEFAGTEVRMASSSSRIHDRFLMDNSTLCLLGHGLKDIGKKQSFIIRINRSEFADVVDALAIKFDQWWDEAVLP